MSIYLFSFSSHLFTDSITVVNSQLQTKVKHYSNFINHLYEQSHFLGCRFSSLESSDYDFTLKNVSSHQLQLKNILLDRE